MVGPIDEGKQLARSLYPIFREKKRVPSFFVSRRLTKKLVKQFYACVCATAVVTFGPESEEVYDAILRDHSWVKVMRILEPGAPEPEPVFDYRYQVFPYPDQEYLSYLVSWLGIDLRPGIRDFSEDMPGALTQEELEAAPDISPQGGPT